MRAESMGVSVNDTKREHREGDRQAELVEELPDHALHECHRHEHRDDTHGGGENGEGDLGCALLGCLARACAQLCAVSHDVLDDDDGVVDEDADGEREGQRGHHVEREAHDFHEGEGADDRGGQGQRTDERGTPVAKEEEDDGHGQHGAEHEVELHRVHGGADVLRVVDQHV
jgi:hypothetical protein